MNRPMDKPLERPGLMGAAPESGSLPNTLLTYLVRVSFQTIGSSSSKVSVLFCLFHNFLKYVFRILSG